MRVGIALGSNLGDRAGNLRAAVSALRELAHGPLFISKVYETKPVDCPPGSEPFLNAAVEIGYEGDLLELLAKLQATEQFMGRPEIHGLNAPRTLDLDILYADDLTVDLPELKVPHPRLKDRLFVLLPLNDIAPNRNLPGEKVTVGDYLSSLKISDINVMQVSIG